MMPNCFHPNKWVLLQASSLLLSFILLLGIADAQTPEQLPYNPGCSAWYSKIPANAGTDAMSDSVATTIANNRIEKKTKLTTDGEAPGTYLADPSTDSYYEVTFSSNTYKILVPDDVIDTRSETIDAPIIVYNRENEYYGPWTELRLYKAAIDHTNKKIGASGGGLFKYNTDGITRDPWGEDDSCSYPFLGGGTGSGMSWIGMIRPYDIMSGVINHAIRIYFSPCDFGPDTYRWPAIKSDQGGGSCCGCAEMGMRIQLDSSVDCMSRTVPVASDGWNGGDPEKQLEFLQMLCIALQDYGGIFVDGTGNKGISIMMEDDRTANWESLLGAPHPDIGWSWITRDDAQPSDTFSANRDSTSGIPWDKFRVVETLFKDDQFHCIDPPTTTEPTLQEIVYPVADSYVQAPPDFDDTNWGYKDQIRIKYSGDNYKRTGYFQWKLPSDLTLENIQSVVAHFTVEKFHSSGFDGELQSRAAFSGWDEDTITFNERAQNTAGVGFGPILCSWRPQDTVTAQMVDLTDAAKESLNNNEQFVSVMIWSTKGAAAQDVWFPAKEGSSDGVPLVVTKYESPVGPRTGQTPSPTQGPTNGPTPGLTNGPTPGPTNEPTTGPTNGPTPGPTNEPTVGPTNGPTPGPTNEPTTGPTNGPTPGPTNEPTTGPTNGPTPGPTNGPTPGPTNAPTPGPTLEPTPDPGCCSQKFKTCDITSCGTTKEECESCGGGMIWLENGAYPGGTHCLERFEDCQHYPNSCCPGATCRHNKNMDLQCLHNSDSPEIVSTTSPPTQGPTTGPTPGPTSGPTNEPTPGPTPGPTPNPTPGPTPVPTSIPTPGPTPGTASTVPLSKVGNNGSPSSAFPLKHCEGDCDKDDDCADDLLCFRHDTNTVPGCEGTRDGGSGWMYNYCYKKSDLCTPGELCLIGNNGWPEKNWPLGECLGDCDDDDDCDGDLICGKGDGLEVPGCIGTRQSGGNYLYNYCFRCQPGELCWVGNNLAEPLANCEGDCDSDSDCEGELRCYKGSGTTVPGCSGTRPDSYSHNYCYNLVCEPGVLCTFGNNGQPESAFPLGVCQGDCDSDDECATGLSCYRGSDYPLEGCSGTRDGWTNYCIPTTGRLLRKRE